VTTVENERFSKLSQARNVAAFYALAPAWAGKTILGAVSALSSEFLFGQRVLYHPSDIFYMLVDPLLSR